MQPRSFFLWIFLAALPGISGWAAQPDTTGADALFTHAWKLLRTDSDSTLLYLEEVAQIYSGAAGDSNDSACCSLAAKSLYYKGIAYLYNNKFAESHASMDRATAYLEGTIGTKNEMYVKVLYNKGKVYYMERDFATGVPFLKNLLARSQSVLGNESKRTAAIHNFLGVMCMEQGDFASAMVHYEQALDIFVTMFGSNYPTAAQLAGNLGLLYQQMGQNERALQYYEQALKINEVSYPEGHDRLTSSYYNVGVGHLALKHYHQAIEYLEEALARHHKQKAFASAIALTHNKLCEAHTMLGQYDVAQNHIQEALTLIDESMGPNHPDKARTYELWGLLYDAQNLPDQAIEAIDKGLRACAPKLVPGATDRPDLEGVVSSLELTELLANRARIQYKAGAASNSTGWLEQAYSSLNQAIAVIEQTRQSYRLNDSKELLAERVVPVFETGLEIVTALSQHTGDDHWKLAAFQLMERSKAAMLLEALQQGQASAFAGVPEALLQQERDLNSELSAALEALRTEELKGNATDSMRLTTLRGKHFELLGQRDVFLTNLEENYPKYFELKYTINIASKEQLDDLFVGQSTTLVEFFEGNKGLYAFSAGNNGYELHHQELSATYGEHVRDFITTTSSRVLAVEQGNSAAALNAFAELSHELYKTLLEPMLNKGSNKLIVVPDGLLSYVNFELLCSAPNTDTKLRDYAALPLMLRSHTIRYGYSTTAMLATPNRQQELAEMENYAGFAPIYRGDAMLASVRDVRAFYDGIRDDLPPLANNTTEVDAIAHSLSGTAFLNENATETAFKATANRYRVLHLAMHTFTNDSVPLLSGLVFSEDADSTEDGFLKAWEIYNMQLNADLAVLSACNTGRGKMVRGEGLMSLARAFRFAGCPNIVTSLWQAEDASTSWIMQQFYDHLATGMGKDAALRQAKIDYIDSHETTHPFFWSAFVLIGNDAPVELSGTSNNWLWLLASGGALLLIVMGLRKVRRGRASIS